MYSKNIIVLLLAVCFIEKINAGKVQSKKKPTLDKDDEREVELNESSIDNRDLSMVAGPSHIKSEEELDAQWQEKCQEIFKKYDDDNDGIISAKQLQKLIFQEFNGFLTIKQAVKYISLTNLNSSNQLRFEEFIKMKPIIDALIEKGYSEYEQVEDYSIITLNAFQEKITLDFIALFPNKEDTLQLVDLIGQTANFAIESTRFKKIKNMLAASVKLEIIHDGFRLFDKNVDGVIDADELLEILRTYDSKTIKITSAIQMIKQHDKNNDGVIDFNEYLTMMSHPVNKGADRNDHTKFVLKDRSNSLSKRKTD